MNDRIMTYNDIDRITAYNLIEYLKVNTPYYYAGVFCDNYCTHSFNARNNLGRLICNIAIRDGAIIIYHTSGNAKIISLANPEAYQEVAEAVRVISNERYGS